jgi:hypothetical protein
MKKIPPAGILYHNGPVGKAMQLLQSQLSIGKRTQHHASAFGSEING